MAAPMMLKFCCNFGPKFQFLRATMSPLWRKEPLLSRSVTSAMHNDRCHDDRYSDQFRHHDDDYHNARCHDNNNENNNRQNSGFTPRLNEPNYPINGKIILPYLAFSLFGFGKKEEIDEFNLLVAKARVAETNLDLLTSDQLYHQALHVLEERLKMKKITESQFIEKQTVIFDALANINLLQGKVREGEELLKATLQGMFASGFKESDNAVVEISLKLANIYALQNRYPEALAGYRFCYRTLNEKIDENSSDDETLPLLGLTCDNYGRFLLSTDDFINAEHYFLKALEISQKVNGDSHAQSLLIMNNLATLSVSKKDYKESRKYLEKAVRMSGDIQERDFDILAAVYCNLAMVYFHEKKNNESFLALKEAEHLAKLAKNKEVLKEVEECRKKIRA